MSNGTGERIGLFHANVPKVGDRIIFEGHPWNVSDVAMLSGHWAAWGSPR